MLRQPGRHAQEEEVIGRGAETGGNALHTWDGTASQAWPGLSALP